MMKVIKRANVFIQKGIYQELLEQDTREELYTEDEMNRFKKDNKPQINDKRSNGTNSCSIF